MRLAPSIALAALLAALSACSLRATPDTEPTDSDTEDTQPKDTAIPRGASCVKFLEYDAEANCQRWVWEDLDPAYWTEWAAKEVCYGLPVNTADSSGRCIYLNQTCDEPALQDPWLAGCDAFSECCEDTDGPFRDAPACDDFEVDRCAPV